MRKQLFVILSIMMLLLSTTTLPAFAQTKVSGLVFGDYYFVVNNPNNDLENKNGFWLRRVYVTFDHQLDKKLSARVRFEAASPGDFKSSGKIEPFVKHLYLQWKASDNHTLYFGLSGPPTYGVVEEIWGYRHLEKTPLDLYGFAPSSDFGVALKGQLNSQLKYHGMVSNGSGTGAETNSGKRVMWSLGYYPSKTFMIEGYVDNESRPGNENRRMYQLFSVVKKEGGYIGFLLARIHRNDHNSENNFDLASIFVVQSITENLNVVYRHDRMFTPNPKSETIAYLPFDPRTKFDLFLWGLDCQVNKNLSLTPNAELVFYGDTSISLMYRFTLHFTF